MQELTRAQDKIGKFDSLISLKDGRVAATEKRRLYEYPFFLLTDQQTTLVAGQQPNDVASTANMTSLETALRVSGEGPVQMTQLGAVRDATHGEVLVQLYMRDGASRTQISNVPLHIDTIFGQGGQMYPLPEGLYIDEDRALSVTFTNLTDDDTLTRICCVGAKYTNLQADPSLSRVKERLKASEFLSTPQFYGVNDGNVMLTPYQTLQYTIQINDAQNFEIHQLSVVSTGDFLMNIVDMSKGESIINSPRNGNYPIPASLFVGNGSYPYRFHEPVLTFGGQSLLVTFVDTSGSDNTIYLTLGGVALKVRQWS